MSARLKIQAYCKFKVSRYRILELGIVDADHAKMIIPKNILATQSLMRDFMVGYSENDRNN